MDKTTKSFLVLILATVCTIIGGYVAMNLWKWFIAIPFAIKQITLAQAIGIDLLITFWTSHSIDTDSKDDDNLKRIIIKITYTLFIFLLGYIAHLFM